MLYLKIFFFLIFLTLGFKGYYVIIVSYLTGVSSGSRQRSWADSRPSRGHGPHHHHPLLHSDFQNFLHSQSSKSKRMSKARRRSDVDGGSTFPWKPFLVFLVGDYFRKKKVCFLYFFTWTRFLQRTRRKKN